MNFDFQKFSIGVIDFFSVILPGAVALFLLNQSGLGALSTVPYTRLDDVQGAAVFAFVSYVLGHAIFLIGSWLDDLLYTNIRDYTRDKQIKRMAEGKPVLSRFWRVIVWLIFKDDRNQALTHAGTLKAAVLGSARKDAVNNFQWAKSWLRLNHPASLSTVERLEADSKFFRSFAVVLILWLGACCYYGIQRCDGAWFWQGLLVTCGMLLALWRYLEQRFKAINQAYWSAITLAGDKGLLPAVGKRDAPNPPYVASIVSRGMRGGQAEILLVADQVQWDEWVLPGGPCEAKNKHRQEAIRYPLEQARIWASLTQELGFAEFNYAGNIKNAAIFRLTFIDNAGMIKRDCRSKWMTLDAALACEKTSGETKAILQMLVGPTEKIGEAELHRSF